MPSDKRSRGYARGLLRARFRRRRQYSIRRTRTHVDAHDGMTEMQTTTMHICDYLKQGGQTAGHRELWRLLRTLFEKDINSNEVVSNRLS